jgi:excisionase family DNA binding protein
MHWATAKEVASSTRRHVRTVYEWVSAGRIEHRRIAGGLGLLIRIDSEGHPVPLESTRAARRRLRSS